MDEDDDTYCKFGTPLPAYEEGNVRITKVYDGTELIFYSRRDSVEETRICGGPNRAGREW